MSFFSSLGKRFSNVNLADAGALIGGIGQAYGAINSAKMQKKLYNLQKSNLKHQMQDYQTQKARQRRAESNASDAFDMVSKKRKKKPDEEEI